MSSDYEKLFKNAVSAGKRRKYAESLRLFQQLLSVTDDFPQAYLYMGRCCHALDQKEIAVQYFRYFLQRFPDSLSGHFFLGRSFIALGSFAKGLHHLYRVYRENTDYPQLKAFMGLGFLKIRKIDQAVDFLGQAVEEDPENEKIYTGYLNALYLSGIRCFYREEFDMARQIFHFLESRGAENILIDLHLAMIEKEAGNLKESLGYYNRACESSPDDSLIRIQRAELLYRCGHKKEALEEWETIPQMEGFEPGSMNAVTIYRIMAVENFQNGMNKKAFYFATQALKQEKDPSMHLLAGEAARNLGNFEIAANHFTRVIEKNARILEARYGLAMIYWLQEDWQKVLSELGIIRRINPGDPLSRYYTALCLCRLGKPTEETLPLVRDEIRLSGPDPYLLTALAEQYILSDLPELAEKWFQKALQLKEDHKDAYHGLIALQTSQEAYESLFKTYQSYLEHFGDDRDFRKEYALLLFKKQKYKKAIGELESLLPYFSQDSGLQRILACSYRETERFREAALVYRNLLRSEPENQVFLRSLVYCLEKKGDRPVAINLLRKGLAFLPPSSTMYLIFGVLLHRENNFDEALDAFKKAHELSPRDWRALFNIGTIYKDRGMDDYAATYYSRAEKAKKSI